MGFLTCVVFAGITIVNKGNVGLVITSTRYAGSNAFALAVAYVAGIVIVTGVRSSTSYCCR